MYNLNRRVILDLAPNGALTYRVQGTGERTNGLPVYSVDTEEEAKSIQVALCSLSRQDNRTYLLPFTGEFEDLKVAAKYLEDFHTLQQQPRSDERNQKMRELVSEYNKTLGVGSFTV